MCDVSSFWERLFENVTGEEKQGLQRNILRGSHYLALHGQMDQKGTAFWAAHGRRGALVMQENTALGPWHLRLCRADTQVCEASDMPHGIESFCF